MFITFDTLGGAEGEPEWKYCYVYKGPECARQKQIYYVFGKGLKISDNGFLETKYKPEEQSFERPIFYKTHGHIYMELIFLKKGMNYLTEKINFNFKHVLNIVQIFSPHLFISAYLMHFMFQIIWFIEVNPDDVSQKLELHHHDLSFNSEKPDYSSLEHIEDIE